MIWSTDVRALVTGGSGFVGSHMIKELLRRGYDDIVSVDVRPNHRWHVTNAVDVQPRVRYIQRELTHWLELNEEHYDLVVHCAAYVNGRAAIDNDPLGIGIDLGIDAHLFNWCAKMRQPKLVYFSSSAIYPTALQTGEHPYSLEESDVCFDGTVALGVPDASYGWVKLTGEYMGRYLQELGTKVYTFRPFSGYGADQDETYPFRAFIERALRREDPFMVWSGGDQVRDWIHIDDVCTAVMTAVEQDIHGPVNLCTGIGTSMMELIDIITQGVGYNPEIMSLPGPRGVTYRVGSPNMMNTFYTPRVELTRGVDRAIIERMKK